MNEENNIAPVNEELNVVEYAAENIRNLIYTIRGKQVMALEFALLFLCKVAV